MEQQQDEVVVATLSQEGEDRSLAEVEMGREVSYSRTNKIKAKRGKRLNSWTQVFSHYSKIWYSNSWGSTCWVS